MRMEKPTVEAVRFNTADVIATSGVVPAGKVLLSGFGNTVANDNKFQIGATIYGQGTVNNWNALESALRELSGNGTYPYFKISDSIPKDAKDLWRGDNDGWGGYNGTYTWYDTGSYWKHD